MTIEYNTMGRLHSDEKEVKSRLPKAECVELRPSRLTAANNRERLSGEASDGEEPGKKRNDIEKGIDDGLLPRKNDTDDFLFSDNTDQLAFDVNAYQQKKILAQGMMDLALLSANANQLRYVLELSPESRNGFFYVSLILILASLLMQIAVGICLIWNGRYNIRKSCDHHNANRVNNLTLIGIFLLTIVNVFISAFGIPSTTQRQPVVGNSGTGLVDRILELGSDETK